jgi:hypothetical protein
MQKTQLIFLPISILLMTVLLCSCSRKPKSLDSWVGNYNYVEEPIKAIAGYHMTMMWAFSINKVNDSYQGVLEVNGQQTFIKILADISGDTNSIALTYHKVMDGSDENLKKGDTLFLLFRNEDKIKTKWMALEPRLAENPPKECDCFEKVKNNGR